MQLTYLTRGLSMVTPEEPFETVSYESSDKGTPLEPRRLPEAMITLKGWEDEKRTFSPHTPLLWPEALARRALVLLEETNNNPPPMEGSVYRANAQS